MTTKKSPSIFYKIIAAVLIFCLLISTFSGCGSENKETEISKNESGLIGSSDLENIKNKESLLPSPNKAAAKKDYTIMIYMVGSNLESESSLASQDLLEILESGINPQRCNVVIYTGGANSWALNIQSNVNTVLNINATGSDFDIIATTQSAANMGDPYTLSDFLNYAYNNFPADRYSLICWDHGGGSLLGFGSDELYSHDSLSLTEMEYALNSSPFASKKLEFLGFDACLMATMEAAEMSEEYANYLIASEELEPGSGWNYQAFNKFNSTYDTKTIANEIINKYAESFSGFSGVQYSLSCMDLSLYDATVSKMDGLFSKLASGTQSGDYSNIAKSRNKSYRFAASGGYDMVDLASFCNQLSSNYKNEASALLNQLNQFIVSNKANIKEASGVSVYFPYDNKDLYLSAENAWGKNFFTDLCDSKGYCDFISAFTNILINGEPQADYSEHQVETEPSVAPTPTPTPTPSPTPTASPTATPVPTPTVVPSTETQPEPGSLTLQLTSDQLNSLSNAYYTVFEQSIYNGKAVYTPVLKHISVTPDANGVISIPQNVELFLLKTDIEDDGIIWPVEGINNAGTKSYVTSDTYLMATPDTINAMEKAEVLLIENGKEIEIASILSTENSSYGSYGKQDINLEHYNHVAFNYRSYYPTYNASHVLLPNQWWDDNGVDSYNIVSYKEDIIFEKAPISKFDSDFYYQIVLEDTTGNLYGTELSRFPLNKAYETVKYGDMIFHVYSDRAVLYSYEGSDAKVTIPADINGVSVTEIADHAFYYNSDLTELILSAKLKKIGTAAFAGCRNLSVVIDLEKTLTHIGSSAFERCKSLTNFSFPNSLCSIGYKAFADSGLVTVNLPDSLYHIGDGAFSDCASLYGFLINGDPNGESLCFKAINSVLYSGTGTKLLAYPTASSFRYDIPEGVREISSYAFAGAEQLTKVSFPSSLKKINSFAFYNCENLEELNLPDSLEFIGHCAFASFSVSVNEASPVKSIKIDSKVEFIGYDAFDSFPVEEYVVDSANKNYSSDNGCLLNKSGTAFIKAPYMLKGTLKIPEGVNEIKWHALSQCDLITELILADSVVSIDEDIGIPDYLESISVGASLINWDNISDCHYYKDVKISPKNTHFVMKDNCIYNGSMNVLLFARSKETINVPEGVEFIEAGTFTPLKGSNSEIKTINLPSTLILMDESVLLNLYELENVNIENCANYQSENGILYSNDFALLRHCPQGKRGTVEVNKNVVTIYDNAFYLNTKAEKVIVPEGIKSIRRGNFISHRGDGIMELNLPASLTEIYPKMLYQSDKFKVNAPSGSAAAKHAEAMGAK